MRTSRQQMQKTTQRIVDGAALFMREHGIEATSVADVMSEADSTHGGFYPHFEGKDTLMLAALQAGFAQRHAALEQRFRDSAPGRKAAYGANLKPVVSTLAQGIPGSVAEAPANAVRESAMLAGALMLARASDKPTAKLILDARRRVDFLQ